MVGAITIFALTYMLIAGRRLGFLPVSRPAAAWAGAAACVLLGVLTPELAYSSIDGDTILLLVSMMILAAHLDQAGFFDWGASKALSLARTPARLLSVVVFSAGFLSAFLVNDSVCFLMTPFVVRLIRRLRLGATLYLMALATSANIGSVMTIIGSPQMMIVGSLADLDFTTFFVKMAPLGVLCLLLNRLLLPRFYSFGRFVSEDSRQRSEWLDAPFDDADEMPTGFRYTFDANLNPVLLVKCAISIGLALLGFFLGMNVAWTAFAAAGVLLLVAGWAPRVAFKKVDWQLLLFLIGLFVVVKAVRETGVSQLIFDSLQPWLSRDAKHQGWMFSLLTLLGSNIVGNIPFVLLASDWVHRFIQPETAWLLLAMASTFAGNLMLMSSMANVLVRDGGRDVATIGFFEHLRYGIVITLVTTGLGTFWILVVT